MVELEEIKVDNIDLKINLSPMYKNDITKDVQIILFKVNYPEISSFFNQKICGKSQYEYLQNVCKGFYTQELEVNFTDNPILRAKSVLSKDYKYTALLFTDTPLLTRSTLLGILDYVKLKDLNFIRLYRGFVFSTSYLQTVDNVYDLKPLDFEAQDFTIVRDNKTLYTAHQIMQERIINYHLEQGVNILGKNVQIDADVSIKSGATISGSSQILGNSSIDKNANICSSIIENSVIGENSKIMSSTIKQSIIQQNVVVEPYCFIDKKSIICNNVAIKSGSRIENKKITA